MESNSTFECKHALILILNQLSIMLFSWWVLPLRSSSKQQPGTAGSLHCGGAPAIAEVVPPVPVLHAALALVLSSAAPLPLLRRLRQHLASRRSVLSAARFGLPTAHPLKPKLQAAGSSMIPSRKELENEAWSLPQAIPLVRYCGRRHQGPPLLRFQSS